MNLAIAIPVCCRSASEIRVGYALQSLASQVIPGEARLHVFIRDEGPVPCLSDRWTRLILDLLTARGHSTNYLRRAGSQGVAAARHDLLAQIPSQFDRILLLDEDMILMPDALHQLLKVSDDVGDFGFVQGSKLELDAQRDYLNDLNVLNHNHDGADDRVRLYFGDAAFLLLRRAALDFVRWDILLRFAQEQLAGEDVAISLMISDRLPCYGAPRSIGYHMSLEQPRWRWEPATDALQLELLRGVVSAETLRRAMPHMAAQIDAGQ